MIAGHPPPGVHSGRNIKGAIRIAADSMNVPIGGQTTLNLHQLLATLFDPTASARVIVADALNFASDTYALRSHLRLRGLDPARIVCGAGSDDLLNLIARAYLADGDEAIHTTHGFLVYPIATLGTGANPVVAPETDYTANVDAILKCITSKTKVVFLANPNNPTGTYIPFDEVKRLHNGLPPHVLLVLDAAYAEYVRRNDYEAGLELVATSENVVMTRTFSKIHGLAALRLGWMVGPAHIVDAINRIRGPFNVNSAAIAAGIAAIEDHEHQERSREHNTIWLEWVTEEIGKLGLKVTPSVANFVLIHFADSKTAAACNAFLMKRGLILRQVTSYKLPNCLRMTVGSEEANRLVIKALGEFLGPVK